MHVNHNQNHPSPSPRQTLDAEMLSDLESFLDGREFIVTAGMKLQFAPGEDKESPLDIHITAERKGVNRYNLVIRFSAQYDNASKISLTAEGLELSVSPASSTNMQLIDRQVSRGGALQFGPLKTGSKYVFNFQPGVFAKLEAPRKYLDESAALEQPKGTEPETPSTADTVVADGSLSDTALFDK